jgi:3-hydroxyacyl-CoA dehydrogenase
VKQIVAANYDEHLALLKDCDLVIEAISERMDWKKALFEKVAPHIAPNAIFASNTSGLSITELSKTLPAELRKRFCGIHFFNPPRYMRLVEIIPTPDTDPAILDRLETFLTTTLGKGVIRAKDTPNFVANRVGVFSMLATMHHTTQFNLGFDVVDALTGTAIGRAKSATYGTADVVGLDTMAHVIKTMGDTLPADPWAAFYRAPDWLAQLVAKGALGRKAKAGVYMKKGKDIHVLDLALKDYRPSAGDVFVEVQAILKEKNPGDQLAKLRASSSPQAQFLWSIFRDLFHYAAVHLGDIAHSARDVDLAIRWGFGWTRGPFELWQAGRLAAGGQVDRRRHRRRQGHGQGAVARVGHGRAHRRAQPRGFVFRGDRQDGAPLEASRLRAAAFPRDGDRRETRRSRHDGVRGRRRAHVAPGRSHRDRLLQEQDAFARHGSAAGPESRDRRGGEEFRRARDLA